MKFSPGVYEHAAMLIGRTPWEVSRSEALLVDAHRTAWEVYRHPMVVAGIDVYNLEAEAYGAVIAEPPGGNVPSIGLHPCSELGELIELPVLDPLQHQRISDVLNAAAVLREVCPGAIVRVPVCGPIALGSGLLGMENLLIALLEDEETTVTALNHLLEGQIRYLQAIRNAGVLPVIFESGSTPPLMPPRLFERVEAPLLRRLFDASEEIHGERPPCIIGGDAVLVAEAFFDTKPGFVIAPSETDQAAFLRVASRYPDIHVRVNMSAALLAGSNFDPIQAEAERAITLAKTRDRVSVGCGVVPYHANPEVVCRLRDFVQSYESAPVK